MRGDRLVNNINWYTKYKAISFISSDTSFIIVIEYENKS